LEDAKNPEWPKNAVHRIEMEKPVNRGGKMVKKFLFSTRPTWATLPLRIALGLIFMAHGGQKLFGWFGGPGLQGTAGFFQQMGFAPAIFWATLAACGEFFGGFLVFLGLLTRFGALNITIVMLVAIVKVHWPAFFAPAGIEYPMALLGSALALMIAGGGKFSIDSFIGDKPNQMSSAPR
jgi:putative oxidoreductase